MEGQFAGQDDVLQARTTVDLNSSTRSQSDPFSDNNEKIIGSDDDDIVFASKGNDLFTLVKKEIPSLEVMVMILLLSKVNLLIMFL